MPLNRSINAFSCGLPGRICSHLISFVESHFLKCLDINSGPLSDLMEAGSEKGNLYINAQIIFGQNEFPAIMCPFMDKTIGR